jgi:hypothetical protein
MLFDVNPDRKEVNLFWKEDQIKVIDHMIELVSVDYTIYDDLTFMYGLLHLPIALEETAEENRITSILKSLSFMEKPDVGKDLTDYWLNSSKHKDCLSIATHESTRNCPFFKIQDFPKLASKTNNALPAFSSTVFPQYLSLKSSKDVSSCTIMLNHEYEVLYQAIERVFIGVRMNELINLSVSFATSGRKSWIFIFKRDSSEMDKTGKLIENYYLFPINIEIIIPLYHALNRKDVGEFMNVDCYALSEILTSFGFHIGYCQIQLKAISSGRVYSVTPGVKDVKISIPTDDASKQSFVIKLTTNENVTNDNAFPRANHEIEILEVLKSTDAVSYVIATVQSTPDNNSLTINEFRSNFFENNNHEILYHKPKQYIVQRMKQNNFTRFSEINEFTIDLKSFASKNCQNKSCYWNCCQNDISYSYSAIIMLHAIDFVRYHEYKVMSDLNRCLKEIHEKKILHCDLRKFNLMEFSIPSLSRKYFIIDFNLSNSLLSSTSSPSSTSFGESVELTLPTTGGQRQVIEELIQQEKIEVQISQNNTINWDEKCDSYMLLYSLLALPFKTVSNVKVALYPATPQTFQQILSDERPPPPHPL